MYARIIVFVALSHFVISCNDSDDKKENQSDSAVTTVKDAAEGTDMAKLSDQSPMDSMQKSDHLSDVAANDATRSVSFSERVQPIFNGSCAFPGCHGGDSPRAKLNLSTEKSYADLVNTDSIQCTALKRVEPGAPEKSYLMHKLEGAGACFTKSRMPPGENPLPQSEIEEIHTWIKQGAKNN